MKQELIFQPDAPLNKLDTESTTYGCRQNNPKICKNCYMDGICAFVNKDEICYQPSRAWKKKFLELKEKK